MFLSLYEKIDIKIVACGFTETTKVCDLIELIKDMGIQFFMSQTMNNDIITYKFSLFDVSERSLKIIADSISA